MFIAINRFQVNKGLEQAFETVWKTGESHLGDVEGFIEFHLVKGPEAEDHTLYATHTVWADYAAFDAWTRSEAFSRAHSSAGNETGGSLFLDHPKFEGFEVLITERASSTAA
ncbi:heme-degrading monooxygenase HmoA [Bradyrhizobium sp. USDA 4524]|uniref:antibiotic biosynthesis monooxygenase family protein n=1 Tax=unclassified Bradyrhizobium TaxID=2631580 RepID=UPI0020A040CE|nr:MULTISPECIES: antibiotic biosynthesis monooxygenase [unclassified Bradyrhizobium]MCP1846156.1 heme-degrading monooxygenase HmoA [Bradyrhizobium sp. USDA 4538]MCP1907209.1 heme-degrading monooxygenase HmoA [Bradyrhizobium sp. USDA 4537]MCP1985685.1 heme-degrading monooxygenase HmoA [Bradyrhizobium sp. USDA 4539]